MTLEIGLKIIYNENVKHFYLQDYESNILSDGYSFAFDMRDFDKIAHAQQVLNEECVAAIKRTDERLLAEGFDKIQMPRMRKPEDITDESN